MVEEIKYNVLCSQKLGAMANLRGEFVTPGKRQLHLKESPLLIGHVFGTFSLLSVDVAGPSPPWAVPSLGR